MNLEEYKIIATERLNPSIANDVKASIDYASMGIVEETGEVIAEFRKALFKGNYHERNLNEEHIVEEISDVMWYLALVCKRLDINMDQLGVKIKDKSELPKEKMNREELIEQAIILGISSGKLVGNLQNHYYENEDIEKLKESIKDHCQGLVDLTEGLSIDFNDVLEYNIKKSNRRYRKNGNPTR